MCWDMDQGIPFGSGSEEGSLEHFPGRLRECRLVLRPGGILRIVVPGSVPRTLIHQSYRRGIVPQHLESREQGSGCREPAWRSMRSCSMLEKDCSTASTCKKQEPPPVARALS